MHRRRSHDGFSLVEILIALGAISMVLVASTTYFSKRMREQRVLSIQATKARIVQAMESFVTDPTMIMASLEKLNGINGSNNGNFLNCLVLNGKCPANHLGPANYKPMDFYSPDGKGGYLPLTSAWSSSGSAACISQDTLDCPFQVRVFFWFQCEVGKISPSDGSCSSTTHAYLVFQLTPTSPGEAEELGMNLFHPTKDDPMLKPENFAYAVPVKELRTFQTQMCASNQYVDSYDSKGMAVCRCLNNKPQMQANGTPVLDAQNRPICESNDCPLSQILLGFEKPDSNGYAKPVCLSPSTPHCYKMKLGAAASCPYNYWIAHIEYANCQVNQKAQKKKEAATQDLVCGNDTALCCLRYE